MSGKSDLENLKGPTLYLVAINALMFILTSILGGSLLSIGPKALIIFGLSLTTFTQGLIWTPLTSIFTHSGIAHVGSNMIFLFIYGFKLEEDGYRDKQIYFTYIVSGLSAGILSMLIFPTIFQVGASGSVFGVLGTNFGLQQRRGDPNSRKVLFAGIIFLVMASGENVNVFAHLIGFVAGIIIGRSEYFEGMGLEKQFT